MGMSVGGEGGPVSEPNIVPLIDVLLVLIIIFMVITPRTPTGLMLWFLSPRRPTRSSRTGRHRTIVVQVMAVAKLMINQDDQLGSARPAPLRHLQGARGQDRLRKGRRQHRIRPSRPRHRYHARIGHRSRGPHHRQDRGGSVVESAWLRLATLAVGLCAA